MSVFRAAFSISFFTAISRIFGFVRDIAIAYKLGTGPAADILFIALKIPNLFRRIFAEGAFSQAFVPSFSKALVSQGEKEAFRFANHIFFYFLFSLAALTIIFEIFMPQIMYVFAPGYINIPEKYEQVVTLARITFPYIILISLVTLINGILNSYKIFIPGSIMPIIYNITLILSLFTLSTVFESNTKALAAGLLISGLLQFIIISAIGLKKNIFLIPKRMKKKSKELTTFWKTLIPAMLAASIIQLNTWVDTIIATLIPNAVSYLYYSDRLVQLPLSILGIALATAMLPTLSQEIKKKNFAKAEDLLHKSINLGLFFALPAAIGLYVFSTEIITTLFARGEFGTESVNATSKMMAIYSLALPAFILIKVLLSNFYARSNTKTPVKISGFILILNIVLNLTLIQYYSYLGLAIATVISSWLNVLILYTLLKRKNYCSFKGFNLKQLQKIIINSALMTILLIYFKEYIFNFEGINQATQALYLTALIGSGIIFYFLTSLYTKTYSKSELKELFRK